MDTERRNRREDVRVMYNLPNKISGSVETNSMDSEYFKKKGVNKGFPLNQMRRRQSGSIGNNNQPISIGYQMSINSDKGSNVANSYQENEKQMMSGSKASQGQQKIKINSAQANGQQQPSFSRLNSDNNSFNMGTEAMRNSHYQPAASSYAWTSQMGQAANPPRSRQETDFRRKTLQNFNTRSNKALAHGTTGMSHSKK